MVDKIIQPMNLLELIEDIYKMSKQRQAAFLTELQMFLSPDDFKKVRKLYLDSTNDYTRSVIKEVFGDSFEGIN